jgi:phosphoribosylglycinamide formyltransferase-1/phosphoribosylamine--glycine ligase/phosphoribosylglycinamide formyltransferase/phosphoribosylformylglycinamidine cyclo-ligase
VSFDSEATLARLRAICLGQPLAAEKTSHGMPHFHIERGRGFAWYLPDHHGCGIHAVAVKTIVDEQDMLIEAEPDLFYRPAYLAAAGWIGMRLDTGDTDWERVDDRIARSWDMAATPRLRERSGR